VRYDDGDTSSVEVGDRWVLKSPAPSGAIQHPLDASSVARRGKVKWGRGWWDVEERGNVWVFVEGGLRVAPASLKTLVCPDRDATSLQLPSDEMDRNLGSSGEWDGDEMVEEEEIEAAAKMRRRAAYAREWQARRPFQRCGVDGCEFQSKRTDKLKEHQARVHGIGDVDAEELRRKKREYNSRQPAQRCGVDGCDYQTKDKSNLKRHQARVHGIVELDGDGDEEEVEEEEEDEAAAERRKKAARERERIARQPVQRCGVDGCEFQTKRKGNLKEHQARVHGIGDVGSGKPKRKGVTRAMRSVENDENEAVAAAPRSRRAVSAVDYAALAGVVDSED
jgi:hypothetical protein